MFDLSLFRIRAFSAGNLAALLAAIARGGLQFMLIIWLQGIWLPLHGYDFSRHAAVGGHLHAAADRRVPGRRAGRPATCPTGSARAASRPPGMLLFGGELRRPAAAAGQLPLPGVRAACIALNGIGSGMFAAPNTSAIMGSVPAPASAASASGMRSTFQNSGTALSIGVFFSLMIAGLARTLPDTLTAGLQAQGVPAVTAEAVATLPPVSTLFAAFLGINPVEHLLGPDVLAGLAPADAAALTGTEFFPQLISGPFHHGLVIVFTAAAGMALVAAVASASRGRRYFHQEPAADRRRRTRARPRDDAACPIPRPPVACSRARASWSSSCSGSPSSSGTTLGGRYRVAPPVLLICSGALLGLVPGLPTSSSTPTWCCCCSCRRSSTGRA